jgi:hypothetical protein
VHCELAVETGLLEEFAHGSGCFGRSRGEKPDREGSVCSLWAGIALGVPLLPIAGARWRGACTI